jgi:gliding motility-associated-like protein
MVLIAVRTPQGPAPTLEHRLRASGGQSNALLSSLIFLFLLIGSLDMKAQLCNGSLGDPIVNIGFGAGSAVHAGALPAGQTSYTYSSADFPIDGSYTVENSTAGSGSVWWSTADHTGNAGGYMMVVNASISKTDYFYKNTITGLCQGTTYEFAAWVMNLLRSSDLSPPNITFMIEKTDGTLLNSYTTGAIALQSGPLWRQFGFYFTTPAGVTSVVIVMRNNSAGGAPANDLALDDITFRPCGPTLTASYVQTTATTDTVCQGSTLTFHITGTASSGYSNPEYQWQLFSGGAWQDIPGANSMDLIIPVISLPAGVYTYRLASAEGTNLSSPQCRVESNTVTLVVNAAPVAGYTAGDGVICSNRPVQFTDTTKPSGSYYYSWDFGDGSTSSVQSPQHLYAQSGTYTTRLIISTKQGCADTAEKTITVSLRPAPVAKFTVFPTDTSIFYPTVTATDESSGGTTCSIDWGDGTVTDCSENTHDYTKPGTYTVREIVTNADGCSDTAVQTVRIRAEFRFFIPNAFTPGNDGLNDLFRPVLLGAENYTFLVFNRIGQQIFETHDPYAGWDGTFRGSPCPPEAYAYKITLYDEAAEAMKTYTGSFLLLRN